jgi:hypothetical protein
MKKIIFAAILFSTSLCFADNWQDKFAEAALTLQKFQFEEAKPLLDEAIGLMESEDTTKGYLYVDRARLQLILNENENVLADVEKAMASDSLDVNEKIRALTTKIIASGRIGECGSAIDDLKAFADLIVLPSVEIKDSKLLIRNAPNSEYFRKLMTCYLMHSGVCYDKDEFVWLNSGMLIAEKINHCGCQKCIAEYAKMRICDACLKIMSPAKQNVSLDELIISAMKYCSSHVKQLEDQKAFLIALVHIYDMKTSIELFENTFEAMFEGIDQNPVFFD